MTFSQEYIYKHYIRSIYLKKFLGIVYALLLIPFLLFISCTNIQDESNENIMIVHYIDVGQGDSILVQVNNKNLLIDAGPKDSKKNLLTYLDSLDIETLDYVIATHPHEDHIGNMSKIINDYKIINFYAPKVVTTTRTFEKMIEALNDKSLKISPIKRGINTIDLGANTKVTIFSPISETTENLNNYSPIMKIQYNKTSFLFTGDAESDLEKEVLDSKANLKADVLKLGHHGSSTSTSEEFLKAVSPSLGIISLGIDNSYGHPHKETIDLHAKYKINILRTDIEGTIVLESDGNIITRNKNISKDN